MENPKRYALSFLILFFYSCQKQILTRQAAVQHNEENANFIKNIEVYTNWQDSTKIVSLSLEKFDSLVLTMTNKVSKPNKTIGFQENILLLRLLNTVTWNPVYRTNASPIYINLKKQANQNAYIEKMNEALVLNTYIPPRYILSQKYNLLSGCLCKNSYFEVEN
jgi:hypothetical protein